MNQLWNKVSVSFAGNASSAGWAELAGVLLRILVICFAAYLINRILTRIIARALEGTNANNTMNPRVATLTSLLQSIVMYIIYFVAGIMVLQELHVQTSSILASAGIIGLAAGLGAQNLIRDVIAGFFILLEDQYAVGDYIRIDGLTGFVREVGLRSTRLVDGNGDTHIIPNGQISKVTNHNRTDRKAVVDVPVLYQYEWDQIQRILNEIAQETSGFDYVRQTPQVVGITDFTNDRMMIRMEAMTLPGRQGELEREIRAQIKRRFDQEGIGFKN
ncbi:MAG: mechanosensitive ion channel family protein [Solirubrobacterales bacterium]